MDVLYCTILFFSFVDFKPHPRVDGEINEDDYSDEESPLLRFGRIKQTL